MSTRVYNKLVKKLDKSVKNGRTDSVTWRDARWKLLQVVRPVTNSRITGLSK